MKINKDEVFLVVVFSLVAVIYFYGCAHIEPDKELNVRSMQPANPSFNYSAIKTHNFVEHPECRAKYAKKEFKGFNKKLLCKPIENE